MWHHVDVNKFISSQMSLQTSTCTNFDVSLLPSFEISFLE